MAAADKLRPPTRRTIAATCTLPLGRSRDMGIVESIPCAKRSGRSVSVAGDNYAVRSTDLKPLPVTSIAESPLNRPIRIEPKNGPTAGTALAQADGGRESALDKLWTNGKA